MYEYKSTHRRHKNKKWATFTHYGTEKRMVTKLFKNTYTGIAFRATNAI
jgi:hypothetical protein